MEQIQIVLAVVLIIISFGIIFFINRETFIPDYKNEKETYIKTAINGTNNPSVLSTGAVQKYKNGDEYIYNLYFNLPAVNSAFQTQDLDKKFNEPREYVNYKVIAESENTPPMEVGELVRNGNGEHILELKTSSDYKGFYIKLGDSLVSYVKI